MSRRRGHLLAATAAVLVTAGVAGGTTASAEPAARDVINKMDGSRLATLSDSAAEGANAISLRSPGWKYRSEAWRAEGPGWDSGTKTSTRVFRNVAADKCLQPASAASDRGTRVVIKKCDGSDLQKWVGHPERSGGNNTGWWMWTPKTDDKLALALDRYNDGSWDTLHLERAYPSSDRLWRIAPDDKPWNL
ncbi:RICIN domain-containing protein [Streptomyces sp. NPDC048172]|uniref:RICIN domain-containing protein n=1 Tax=Streptomyces sp. NPDC048172 TaxID=3365505 RepID=UPI003719A375